MVQLVTIDRMKHTDVPRVAELDRQCFTTPWHESAYYTEVANRSAYYIVARLGEEIVGYSGMWIIMDESHITTIGVDANYRGKKIGEQILLAMIEESYRRGAKRATLEVRETNAIAQNLYRKYGFVPAAIRKKYYSDNDENAVVMWVDDIASPSYQNFIRNRKQELLKESGAMEETDTSRVI